MNEPQGVEGTNQRFWAVRSITENRRAKLEEWSGRHPFLSAATAAPIRIASILVFALSQGRTESEEVPVLREGHAIANAIAFQGKKTKDLVREKGMSFAIRRAVGFSAGGMTFGIPTVALLRETASEFL